MKIKRMLRTVIAVGVMMGSFGQCEAVSPSSLPRIAKTIGQVTVDSLLLVQQTSAAYTEFSAAMKDHNRLSKMTNLTESQFVALYTARSQIFATISAYINEIMKFVIDINNNLIAEISPKAQQEVGAAIHTISSSVSLVDKIVQRGNENIGAIAKKAYGLQQQARRKPAIPGLPRPTGLREQTVG